MSSLRQFLVLLALTVLTIVVSRVVTRYQTTGPSLLDNGDFHQGLQGWAKTQRGEVQLQAKGGVVLSSRGGEGTVAISQPLKSALGPGQQVLLSADVKVEKVQQGDRAWEAARVVLLGYDASGKPMYQLSHALMMTSGSSGWIRYSKTFKVSPDVAVYRVELQLVNVEGRLEARDIGLHRLIGNPGYQAYWWAGVLVWAGTLSWIFLPHLGELLTARNGGTILLLVAAIICGVLMPENIKHHFGEGLRVLYPLLGGEEEGVYRAGHFLLFTTLSVFSFWGVARRREWATRFRFLLVLAVTSETLQLFVAGRTFRLSDMLIDSCGVLLGALVARGAIVTWSKRGGRPGCVER